MSEESRVYGCIFGAHGSTANWCGLYPLNKLAVEQLPDKDDYPPLTRGLFTVPMTYQERGTGFYRDQMIHFGASYNHLSEFWHLWLEKFEKLLCRLYWFEARVHVEIELCGTYAYRWRAKWPGDDVPFYRDPPEPVTEWSFEGGPRDFRQS